MHKKMNKTTKKPLLWWQQILKVLLIVATSLLTSQVATSNKELDTAVKLGIVATSNVLIDVLSSDSKDTAIIITAKPAADSVGTKQFNK
jgi:hypothetical protein